MRLSTRIVVTLFTSLLIVGVVSSLASGAMPLSPEESFRAIWDAITGQQTSALADYEKIVVLELRLPRLLMALLVGALLAQCGAVMQGLFRNPLADPGVIGVSAGAALGAMVAIVWTVSSWGMWTLPVGAFLGGLLTTGLVYFLAQSSSGTSVLFLLLAGIAISAFAGSAIGLMSYYSTDQQLRDLSLWQMGTLSATHSSALWVCLATLIVLMGFFQRQAGALDALLLGESEARHLGIPVERLKRQLVMLTALGVGVAVAFTGMIGFVGLVVPHLIRLMMGPSHHQLLPLSALCGAVLLLFSDLIARQVVQPAELPVGLVTALIGAPFFLALLVQLRQRGGN